MEADKQKKNTKDQAWSKIFVAYAFGFVVLTAAYFFETDPAFKAAVVIILGVSVAWFLLWLASPTRRPSSDRAPEGLTEKAKEREKVLASKIKELEDAKTKTIEIIEDLKATKSDLEEEKSKDEAMLSSIGEGLIVTDNNGKIRLVNRMFENLLEWKASEVIGKHILDTIPMVDEQGIPTDFKNDAISQVLFTGREIIIGVESEYYYVKKNKGKFPVAFTIAPIILGGKTIGAVEVFRDVTREREIDKAKSEFVSLASHQLRTPLSTVNWYTEMLLAGDAGKLAGEQKQYLEEIYKANQRMVSLVNAFLNVSRIELGTFSVEPESLNVSDIVESLMEEMQPLVKEKGITVKTDLQKDLPMIKADPKLVGIVFQNLFSNALKYTPTKGNIEVKVSLNDASLVYDKTSHQKSFVRIMVKDTGYGIPKTQMGKIFTKLFRADNVKQKDTEGTGLGLYLVKAILDQVGGMVWFESEEGQGTAFYAAIPTSGMPEKKGEKRLDTSSDVV